MLICTWCKWIKKSWWFIIIIIFLDPVPIHIPTLDSNIIITNYKSNKIY